MSNIYAAPTAALNEAASTEDYGSLKDAVNGNYDFNVGEVISEAWAKTKGAKTPLLMAFFLYGLIIIVLNVGFELMFSALGLPTSFEHAGVAILKNVVLGVLTVPLGLGLFILGARRSVDAPVFAMGIFQYFDKTLLLFATTVLMYLCIVLGFLALVIPGIYLSIAYTMAMPLLVEKDLSPWQALEVSRKAVGKRWFAMLGFGMFIGLINMLGILALGLGLIWTLPMSLIAYGIVYRNMFGLQAATLAI